MKVVPLPEDKLLDQLLEEMPEKEAPEKPDKVEQLQVEQGDVGELQGKVGEEDQDWQGKWHAGVISLQNNLCSKFDHSIVIVGRNT